MPEETTNTNETPQDVEARPTITIAEKQDDPDSTASEEKPTITIAEKTAGGK